MSPIKFTAIDIRDIRFIYKEMKQHLRKNKESYNRYLFWKELLESIPEIDIILIGNIF